MKTKKITPSLLAGSAWIWIIACVTLFPGPIGPVGIEPTTSQPLPTREVDTPQGSTLPAISGVSWEPASNTMHIEIAPWPDSWSSWMMYVDGKLIPTSDGGEGIIVRPNAALEQGPTGVIVGTLPWVSGLDDTQLPCCGSLQFQIPGAGNTNSYDYNFEGAGCVTASVKACQAEWTTHEGDWIIQGAESIEDTKVIQRGNIHIRNSASLTIKNSELRLERGDTPTIHVYIFVDPGGSLIIDNSKVYPGPEDGGLACVWNRGRTSITNSPTSIHYLDMGDGATLAMDNSSMIFEIGGLLQVAGGKTQVSNSTLGALGLSVPAGGHLNTSNLASGTTFDHWSVQEWIPEAPYTLTFDNVTILKDDFTGEYEHGPYERGWIFFLDPSSHVRLSDSELRKIFLDLRGDSASFQNLKVDQPASFSYRDIQVQNVIVTGQWAFTLTNANATFRDSNYLFLQPSGNTNLNLVNSHMVEFIPRQFTGTISFENGVWDTAGEILGDVGYHSASNNFRMTGSLKLGRGLRENLQWQNAQVTREFEVLLTNAQGIPINQGVIKVAGRDYTTDANGRALFPILFDEQNYNVPTVFEVWINGTSAAQQQVDFFTETPIRLSP